MRKRRNFTPEQKAKIIIEILKNKKTLTELPAEYEVQTSQLQMWKSENLEKMHQIFTKDSDKLEKVQKKHDSEVDELTRQISQLTVEVNWLKKKSGIKQDLCRTACNG